MSLMETTPKKEDLYMHRNKEVNKIAPEQRKEQVSMKIPTIAKDQDYLEIDLWKISKQP